MSLLEHFPSVHIFLRNDEYFSKVKHPQSNVSIMKLDSIRFSAFIRNQTSRDKYRWHQLWHGLLPQEKHFAMQIYEPNTCFSNSHTNNNLQIGLLKAFWNSYLFLCWYNWTYTLIQPMLSFTLKHSQGAKYLKDQKICIFSLMSSTIWQTDQGICTLHKLLCWASRAHRLKFEHTYCLLIGTKDEDVLIFFRFFCPNYSASYLQSIV